METWTLTWTKLAPINTASTLLDNIPGVYRLSYKNDEDGNYYVFYVGCSEDIKKQILDLISDDGTNVCIKNYIKTKECVFRYAQIGEEYVRKAITKQAFNYYQPSCNSQPPEGRSDVEGNLTS